MEQEQEELLLICSNCTHFFPATMEESTSYGICLEDKAFGPYIEGLFEEYNYEPCKGLVEEKKIHGDTEACGLFEEPGGFEIDDNSHFGKELKNIKDKEGVDANKIEMALLLDEFDKIDWATVPIDNHVARLNSPDKNEQSIAISTLGSLANSGNEKALDQLVKYFKELPSPVTLDEVHFKMEVFRHLNYMKYESIMIPHVIDELYHIQSNNATRQWISKILKYLGECPINMIRDPLEKLLKEKKFSHKLRARIKDTILISEERHIYG